MANQAAWLKEKGKPLEIGPSEQSTPGADEIVVRNHAVAINPVDWKVQDYGFFVKQFPTILGSDIAGEVVKVGPDVSKFRVGDRVVGHGVSLVSGETKHAAFQLYTVVRTNRAAKLPNKFSFADGAVLPLAVSTAADGLYGSREKGLLGLPYPSPEGKTDNGTIVVVYGASSSVGALTVQLAAASGVKVIGIASAKNSQFVRDAGASETFDYKDTNVVEKVVDAVKKSGLNFVGVYDAISLKDQSYHITVPILEQLGGNLATVLPPPEQLPTGVRAGNVFSINATTDPVWADFVTPALEQGTLRCLPPAKVVGTGLESIQKGLAENKKGVSASKVVVEL